MADVVIDLSERRAAREAPDADCIRHDDFGRPLYLFGLQYRFAEALWAIDLWAYSFDDAAARVAAMRDSLTVFGQIMGHVPG